MLCYKSKLYPQVRLSITPRLRASPPLASLFAGISLRHHDYFRRLGNPLFAVIIVGNIIYYSIITILDKASTHIGSQWSVVASARANPQSFATEFSSPEFPNRLLSVSVYARTILPVKHVLPLKQKAIRFTYIL